MNISVTIQTHPLRLEMAELLAAEIGADVTVDPDPDHPLRSPWRCYRHALETTPADATHRVVIQDDVTACRDFAAVLPAAVAARPYRLLSFFVGGVPIEHSRAIMQSCENDDSWAQLDAQRWCPAVALAWPVQLIEPFLQFVDAQPWPETFRSDDEIIGHWLRASNQLALATVPSLIEHPDVVESLLGPRRNWAGENRGRVAACFIHPDCDPHSIDWARGPQ